MENVSIDYLKSRIRSQELLIEALQMALKASQHHAENVEFRLTHRIYEIKELEKTLSKHTENPFAELSREELEDIAFNPKSSQESIDNAMNLLTGKHPHILTNNTSLNFIKHR